MRGNLCRSPSPPAALSAGALTAVLAVPASAAEHRPHRPDLQITDVQYDSPGRDDRSHRSLNREWVEITNHSRRAVNLDGWTLEDEEGHTCTFDHYRLGGRATVRIHTGVGRDTRTDLFQERRHYVWDNRSDTATAPAQRPRPLRRRGLLGPPPQRPRRALPALCLTQITSWGIVYYAFPVLNPQITSATGWSATMTTAAFSAALLVSALASIRVGRILDIRGPRTVMTTGSVIGTASLIIIATAPNLALFTAGWLLAGLAMASTFYQPAFAALTRWWAPDHVRALTIVTLAGGLASTVFAPLTTQLVGHFSWRHTYLILAAVLAAVTVPVHAFALRGPWPPPRPRPQPAQPPLRPSSPAAAPSCSWPPP